MCTVIRQRTYCEKETRGVNGKRSREMLWLEREAIVSKENMDIEFSPIWVGPSVKIII